MTNILGSNDRVLLKLRYYVARSYIEEGLNIQALQMNLEIFDRQKTHLGEGDADTLQTQCQIANLCHRVGNAAAALQLYERALEMQKNYLGEDHPDTFKTKSDIAFHYSIVEEVDFITQFMEREGLL